MTKVLDGRWLRLVCLLFVIVVLRPGAGGHAWGQTPAPTPTAREAEIKEARDLMSESEKLGERGEYAEALRKSSRALEIRERLFGQEHPDVGTALVNVAYFTFKMNDYRKARELHERALAVLMKTPGPEDTETANAMNNYAVQYYAEGNVAKAEELFKRAVEIQEKALRIEQGKMAVTTSNVGLMAYDRGDYATAEEYFQRALKVQEQLEPDGSAFSLTLTNLALTQFQKGNYGEAIRVLTRALDIFGKNFKQDPPDALPILNALLISYVQAGIYDKAEAISQRALAVIEKHPGVNSLYVTLGYNFIGQLHKVKGDYKQAEQFYRRALDTLEATAGASHPYAAEFLTNLGVLYAEQDDYPKAGEMLERALTMRRYALGTQHPHYASSLVNLASLHLRKGQYAEAESMLNEALAIFRGSFGERHPHTAAVLSHLSPLQGFLGNFEKAKEYGELALSIRRDALGAGHVETATSMFNLAELHWMQGEFTEAKELFEQVLPVIQNAAGPKHPTTARAMYYLGLFYLNRKEPQQAEDLLWRSLDIREQALRPGHQEIAQSVRALARVYEEYAWMPKAQAFLQKGLALIEKTPDTDRPSATMLRNDIGSLLGVRGDARRAESLFQRAIAINEKATGVQQYELAISLNSLAMVHHGRGDLDGAESLYRRALGVLEQAQQQRRPWYAGMLKNLSGLYAARGDIARALDSAKRADEVEEYNLGLMLAKGSENQNRAFWIRHNESTMANISLHIRSAPTNEDAARLAFNTVLRRKGRVLDELIANRQALRGSLSEKDRDLLARFDVARSRLAAQVAAYPDKSGTGYDPKVLAKFEEEYQRLEAAVSASGAASREQAQPIDIESVRKLIPEGAALVEFVAYDPVNFKARTFREALVPARYVVYVLRHDGKLAWADLGGAFGIDDRIWNFRIALRNPDGNDVRASARAVDEKLMRPVRKLLGDAQWLLVSPDVSLHLIPFEALLDEEGHYLTERFLFTYLNSTRELSRLQHRTPGGGRPLIVANPDFNLLVREDKQTPPESVGANPQPTRPAGFNSTPLTGTEEEADQIKKILPEAQVLTGAAATEAALKQSHGPSILHIATHAFFPKTVPWGTTQDMSKVPGSKGMTQSLMNIFLGFYRTREGVDHIYSLSQTGIVLAGANTRQTPGGEDGILTAFELSGLDLWGTNLVVLSACETAVGDVERGNGVYGLRRALALAGAESQVMSLWKVDDETTKAIMVRFYTRLRAGEGRSEALRQIKLEILKSQEYSHPYYWAGFIQSGDWRSIDAPSN